MPENPLLPHRKLRELHALMLTCRKLTRHHTSSSEALLAATTLHLQPGDLLCSTDPTLAELAPANKVGLINAGILSTSPTLPTAAAAARGQQATFSQASTAALTLAFTSAGKLEPGWQAALIWAQQAQLPLLLAVADATGTTPPRSSTKPDRITWDTATKVSKKLGVPVVAVDGEDAVAVYRVMQESAIRARYGGGPAIIWAVLSPPSAAPLPRSRQPLARLEKYLAVRKITLPSR